jgi:hypothetical protein
MFSPEHCNRATLDAATQPSGSSNTVVAEVMFDSVLPWPTNALGTGYSLQLIDSHQDNWRVGNWASQAADPGATNIVAAPCWRLFQPLWLNEVEPNNLTGITNSAGQRAPWIELYNPSTNAVSLSGLYLADNYTNYGQWPFPTNAVISPGQFLVIFADGQTNLSTTNQLHTSFVLPGSSGSLALSRFANASGRCSITSITPICCPTIPTDPIPDGQSFVRQIFFQPTPGGTNNGSSAPPPSFVPYLVAGSVYGQNFDSLPDPGSTSVDSGNPVTIDGITYLLPNPYDFAFPVSASGNNGGLGLPVHGGLVWTGRPEGQRRRPLWRHRRRPNHRRANQFRPGERIESRAGFAGHQHHRLHGLRCPTHQRHRPNAQIHQPAIHGRSLASVESGQDTGVLLFN